MLKRLKFLFIFILTLICLPTFAAVKEKHHHHTAKLKKIKKHLVSYTKHIKHTKHKATSKKHRTTKEVISISAPTATATPITVPVSSYVPSTSHLASEQLLNWVHKTALKVRYSHYKFGGTNFNPSAGVYELDCSGYVNQLLSNAAPYAYRNIVNGSGSYKPTSKDYYVFFDRLPARKMQHDWYKVPQVKQLSPGDILVFQYKHFWGKRAGGHVMVVVSHAVAAGKLSNTYLVRVADSALGGHSNDTRKPHASGIGIGTLMIKVSMLSGKAYAYAWRVDAPWRYNMRLAMGRPIYA
jgi:hypothetical protein